MKFEIDPNELSTDQRAYVAAFITNWPMIKLVFDSDQLIPTEEQRLDVEQKSDLEEARDIEAAVGINLNAIFGTPTATERAKVDSLVPLDSQGIPWDSRIHSSSKTTIAYGTWKLRRGVDPTEVEKVKAQLKELMDVPQALVTDLHAGVSTTPVPPAPILRLAEIVPPAPKAHYLIDQQPEVVEIPLVRPPATVTLTDLIGRMSAAIVAGKLTQASVAEICTKHGVSEFHLLSNRPDLLPLIDADMKAIGV